MRLGKGELKMLLTAGILSNPQFDLEYVVRLAKMRKNNARRSII